MNPGDLSLREMLPHGESMVFVDEMLSHDETRTRCRIIPDRHPKLAEGGRMSPWVGLEYLGQTACVHTVLEGGTPGSEGGLGVLIGVRGLTVHVDGFDPETPLVAEVEELLHDGALQSSRGTLTAEPDGTVLVEGRLNAYLPEDQSVFPDGDDS